MTKKSANYKKLTPQLKTKIRNEFVYGNQNEGKIEYPTLDALIKKHGVAKATLYRHASQEDWKEARDNHQSDFERELEKTRLDNRVKEASQFDDTSINLAKGVYSNVAKMLQTNSQVLAQGGSGLNTGQLRALIGTVAIAQKVAKLALGESTENINANITQDDDKFREAVKELEELARQKSKGELSSVH